MGDVKQIGRYLNIIYRSVYGVLPRRLINSGHRIVDPPPFQFAIGSDIEAPRGSVTALIIHRRCYKSFEVAKVQPLLFSTTNNNHQISHPRVPLPSLA